MMISRCLYNLHGAFLFKQKYLSTYGRNTQGVKLINVDEEARVATIALINREEEEIEEESDEEEN